LLAACACAGTAGATVTAISSGGSDGSRYPIITGDGADDTITVTCGSDGNVKINGLDPVARFGTPGPVPIACADMTSVGVTGGDGNDTIDLSAVSRDAGFVNPRLCAPCSNNAWAIYSDCEDNGGNDSIISSPIGGLMGGCGGGTPMTGADVVIGGDGREEVTAGPGDDQINLGGGKDSVSGGSGSDRLRGGAGNDSLSGDAGADALNGGPGHDRCDGGPGADTADACEVIRGI
jgi:Ca2+-binding RTX toxin-like protein